MTSLKQLGKSLTSTRLWVDAAGVIVGFKASGLLNGLVGERLGFVPAAVKPFVGPVLVVAGSRLIPDAHTLRDAIAIGGITHAANTILGMVGIKGL